MHVKHCQTLIHTDSYILYNNLLSCSHPTGPQRILDDQGCTRYHHVKCIIITTLKAIMTSAPPLAAKSPLPPGTLRPRGVHWCGAWPPAQRRAFRCPAPPPCLPDQWIWNDLKTGNIRKLVTTCYHQIVSICWELSTCFNRLNFPWSSSGTVMMRFAHHGHGRSWWCAWRYRNWMEPVSIASGYGRYGRYRYLTIRSLRPRRSKEKQFEAPTQWPSRGEHHPLTSKLPPVPCNVLADAVDILSCPIQTSNLAWYHYQWL